MVNIFDDLPAWAMRFNFTAHSPSGSIRPNCKEFFEKAVARPQKLYSPPGCRMIAGKVAEEFAKAVVINGEDLSEAFRTVMSSFDSHKILEHDPSDLERHRTIRDSVYEIPKTDPKIVGSVLELTCMHTAEGLKAATQGSNQISDGRWVSVKLEGVELNFIGEIDVEDPGVVEIKTRWPTLTDRVKRGWQINSLPSKPDFGHVQQVALYWQWLRQQSENVQVKIVYANCKGFRVFTGTDCVELSESRLADALDRMRLVAKTREKLMKGAESIEDLLSMVAPDFSHFMWKDVPPAYRAAAEQRWGV